MLTVIGFLQTAFLFPVSKEYFSGQKSSESTQGESSYLAAVNEKTDASLPNKANTNTSADSAANTPANISVNTSADTSVGSPSNGSSGPSFLFLWLRLIVILSIFGLLAYIVYRFVLKNYKKASKESPLFHPITEFSLAVNKQLRIVRIVNEYYILAVTQESVSLIAAIEDKEAIDELRIFEESSASPAEKTEFFIDIFKGKGVKNIKVPKALDITRNLHERLKRKQL